jgi:hypothetical protein
MKRLSSDTTSIENADEVPEKEYVYADGTKKATQYSFREGDWLLHHESPACNNSRKKLTRN